MNIITRRQALTRLGATSAAVTLGGGATVQAAEAAIPAQAENPELYRLHERLLAWLEERAAATAEIARIAADWRDRWPLVPEDLLGPIATDGARDDHYWCVERDIAGAAIAREVSSLSKKTLRGRRRRLMNEREIFLFWQTSRLREHLDLHLALPLRGRTPGARERHARWRDRIIAEAQERLDLALQYDAEKARVLEVSGMNVAKARLTEAARMVLDAREELSRSAAWTRDGLFFKAKVLHEELAERPDWLDSTLFDGHVIGRMHRLALQMADA